jgi:HSP20 family protein
MLIRRLPSLPSFTSALRDWDDVRRDMERVLDSMTAVSARSWVYPPIHVSETDDEIVVRAELPGIDARSLDVTMEQDTLTISGERRPQEEKNASYHRRERSWGTFRRSFTIPRRVDSAKVAARYVNGILTVELPKAAEARPRQITVQAGA